MPESSEEMGCAVFNPHPEGPEFETASLISWKLVSFRLRLAPILKKYVLVSLSLF